MANRRMISKALTLSKQLNHVSLFSQDLFTRIVAHADDWGRQNADTEVLLGLLWPIGRTVNASPLDAVEIEVTEALLEAGLRELSEALGTDGTPLIEVYEANGGRFLCLPKWESHQSGLHKRTGSQFPEKPADSRKFPEIPGNSQPTEQKGTELNRREGNGAAAPAAPSPSDDAPILRPLAVSYCQHIRHVTNTQARQELNQTSLEFERHELYDEELWTESIESFARCRLADYRSKHNGKYPPLVYICKAIVSILKESRSERAA